LQAAPEVLVVIHIQAVAVVVLAATELLAVVAVEVILHQ
jgi:hypothetical protein